MENGDSGLWACKHGGEGIGGRVGEPGNPRSGPAADCGA
jgi:hypothetical protein